MSAIIGFYRGSTPDSRGRLLAEILAWDDDRLESVHDFIQWLFPLPERSAFNIAAPLLTPDDIAAFRGDPALQAALKHSFERMLQFYGFARDGVTIVHSSGAAEWLTQGNHNFLRITRILRSLSLLGVRAEAEDFLAALETLYTSGADRIIGPRTREFWRGAVRS